MTWTADYSDYFTARAPRLRRLGYALCGDWHLAEDLVQHTFLQLYRHCKRVDTTTIDAYTRRTLVNAFLSHKRDRRHETVLADPPDLLTADGTDLARRLDLRRALADLPPRQRALVVLRHLEDVSTADAAEILGIAEGTVKSQTAHGLAKLRTALSPAALSEEPV
ncbi:RNA polymerase sigma-70 factor (sigma-E family) [Allocatelliglobosispora scoriae]|uniref:RNA polymerase sigma-70 factor (Sigma-E family) n=1 Tax=Allocatelliglobosispora scoriae TaxID=643052 RepID=A0A841BK14_9ACTN|nr:SigE family RNA polymerase sigma factor [Allocatelliglobosispora scoriae]MBB5867112.1 RNA polymerase sigma-70 factor (sigma-E family) [Allocatelliglobosispora scoriae]